MKKTGRKPDKRITEAPFVPPHMQWVVDAFWELNTTRQMSMGVGPIPFTAILKWAEFERLSWRLTNNLRVYIQEMDNAYMKYHNRQTNTAKKGAGKNGQKNTVRPRR